jgi:uncharacterized protein with von Willebrand factor type A (vWA) domain
MNAPVVGEAEGGRLAENIAFFARTLRAAGMPVGPKTVIEAIEALQVAGIGSKQDLYWVLHAIFVTKREHSVLFEQAFRVFFRRRGYVEKMIAQLSRVVPGEARNHEEMLRRITEALFGNEPPKGEEKPSDVDIDARMTVSDTERFRAKDFEQMTAVELARAKAQVADLVMPLEWVSTRRFRPDPHGHRIDARRSLRASLRAGGATIDLKWRARAEKRPPLVAICDISGSMASYSRIFLHFLHALTKTGRKVHTFVFATELTNITRALQAHKDPDLALAACGHMVRDWEGGTRIGEVLVEFNKNWSRRVLSGGAVVLLITDGLERRVRRSLVEAMDRLHRSSRRLIWLNPLLRYDQFEAKAFGMRAMLPHVDEFRTLHNLTSIADLCQALSAHRPSREADPKRFAYEKFPLGAGDV